jgi:hypothetical protein
MNSLLSCLVVIPKSLICGYNDAMFVSCMKTTTCTMVCKLSHTPKFLLMRWLFRETTLFLSPLSLSSTSVKSYVPLYEMKYEPADV